MEVKQSVRLPAPAAEVWKIIGGFDAFPDWHPMVEKSQLADGGEVRTLSVPGVGTLVQHLDAKDDKARTYSYTLAEGPLPVQAYHATIRVRAEGDGTLVEWESRFEPNGSSSDEAATTFQGILQAGFQNLQTLFGGAAANG